MTLKNPKGLGPAPYKELKKKQSFFDSLTMLPLYSSLGSLYSDFEQHLKQELYAFKDWSFSVSTMPTISETFHLRFRCGHGLFIESSISFAYACETPQKLAAMCLRQAVTYCGTSHIGNNQQYYYPNYYLVAPNSKISHDEFKKAKGTWELATGAAALLAEKTTETQLGELIPGLVDARSACPECKGATPIKVTALVVHLNDKHKWTREAIADFLDTLPYDLTIHPKKEQVSVTN